MVGRYACAYQLNNSVSLMSLLAHTTLNFHTAPVFELVRTYRRPLDLHLDLSLFRCRRHWKEFVTANWMEVETGASCHPICAIAMAWRRRMGISRRM